MSLQEETYLIKILVVSSCLLLVWSGSEEIGPYYSQLTSLESCPDEFGSTNEIMIDSTKIHKISRHNFMFNSNFTLKVAFSDNITGSGTVEKFGNGGWKPNFFNFEFGGICRASRRGMPGFLDHLLLSMNQTDCPILPGSYHVIMSVSDFQNNLVPQFVYGEYRGTILLQLEDRVVGCFRGTSKILPKKKKRQYKKP